MASSSSVAAAAEDAIVREKAKDFGGELRCANCGFEYLHFGEPAINYGGDDYDTANPMHTRGSWIEIPFWCEGCDKITILNISFHKGQTLYRTYVLKTGLITKDNFVSIDRKSPPSWDESARKGELKQIERRMIREQMEREMRYKIEKEMREKEK
jgi:hypothetical protein